MAARISNAAIFNNLVFNTGTTVGPTVFYQGDGKKRKRRKKSHDTDVLFADLEKSLRNMVFGVEPTPASVVAQSAPVVAVDHTQGIDRALDQLAVLAQEGQEYSTRLARLRQEISAYETFRAQAEEDDEAMMVLL